jgi:hypothetical protein
LIIVPAPDYVWTDGTGGGFRLTYASHNANDTRSELNAWLFNTRMADKRCRLLADFVAEVGDGQNEAAVSMFLSRLLRAPHLAVGSLRD